MMQNSIIAFTLVSALAVTLNSQPLLTIPDVNADVAAGVSVKIGAFRQFDSVVTTSSSIKVRSSAKTNETATSLFFNFDLNGPPRGHLHVKSKSGGESGVDISPLQMALVGLVEFNSETDIKGSTSKIMFNDQRVWSDLKSNEKSGIVDGVTIRSWTTSMVYVRDSVYGDLDVMLKIEIADGQVEKAGALIRPEGFKYSITIKNYPYKLTNSKLALIQALSVKDNKVEFGSSAKSDIVLGGSGEGSGKFEWDQTVVADGVETAISVSPQFSLNSDVVFDANVSTDGDEKRCVAFELPRATTIYWDPQVFMSAANSLKFGYLLMAILVLLQL